MVWGADKTYIGIAQGLLGLDVSGVVLLERGLDAKMLSLASSFLSDPLKEPLVRFITTRNFKRYHEVSTEENQTSLCTSSKNCGTDTLKKTYWNRNLQENCAKFHLARKFLHQRQSKDCHPVTARNLQSSWLANLIFWHGSSTSNRYHCWNKSLERKSWNMFPTHCLLTTH